jgi:hypothetical protein
MTKKVNFGLFAVKIQPPPMRVYEFVKLYR